MEGIKKFEELLKTDEDFRKKLQEAAEAYTGDMSEEAVFDNILTPVAAEYGISATFEEYKAYMEQFLQAEGEISADELKQVAGGGSKESGAGLGAVACYGVGVGLGNPTGFCFAIGVSNARQGACAGKGTINNAGNH